MKLFTQYLYPRLILDFITFYPLLMLLGALSVKLELNFELILGFIINFLLLASAFIYNDMEDAKDDAKSKYQKLSTINHIKLNLGMYEQESGYKRFKNPFINSANKKYGYLALVLILLFSILGGVFISSFWIIVISIINFVLGLLYSGLAIRLKSRPILDLISHAILLSTLQIVYFFPYPNASVETSSYLILITVTLYSVGGDLWNEVRDYEEDMDAGLKNTVSYIGIKNAKILHKLISLVAILLGSVAVMLLI